MLFQHNDRLDAYHVASPGIDEDLEDEVVDAEGLDADLGLEGVPHDVEDELAEGLDAGLGLGVPAHDAEDSSLKTHLLKSFTFVDGNLAHVCSSELLREEVV